MTTRHPTSAIPFPLAALAAVVIALSLWGTAQRLFQPRPYHMWEAGMLAESQRAAWGEPIYEDAAAGHATHMYGPLATYLPAAVFRLTGPSFYPARLISLVSVLIAGAIVIAATAGFRPRITTFLGAALLLSFGRAMTDFLEPRPDGASLLLAVVSLLCLYRAARFESLLWAIAGSLILVAGFLFKQPCAMAAAVPVAAHLLLRERLTRRKSVILAAPFAAVAGTIAVMFWTAPEMFHYLIRVPAQFAIDRERLVEFAIRFPLSLPLVWLAAGLWLRRKRTARAMIAGDRRTAWVAAALIVAFPCGVIAAAKTGGMANSLLPAWFAAVGLFFCCAGPLERWLAGRKAAGDRPPHGGALGQSLVGALLLLSFFEPRLESVKTEVTYGDAAFARAVDFTRKAEGRVACFQDPSVCVLAGRPPGRSLVFEYDAAGWPDDVPQYFFDDLAGAEYAVTVGQEGDWRAWPLQPRQRDEMLKELGFAPFAAPGLEGSVYAVWRRESPPAGRVSGTAARAP